MPGGCVLLVAGLAVSRLVSLVVKIVSFQELAIWQVA